MGQIEQKGKSIKRITNKLGERLSAGLEHLELIGDNSLLRGTEEAACKCKGAKYMVRILFLGKS